MDLMFKRMKIGTKMFLLTGVLLVLMLVTLLWGATGLSTTVSNGKEMAAGNALHGVFLAHEIAHLEWVEKLSDFITDEEISELDVETDHTLCAFGKWLHGEGRKEAELLVPELAVDLKAIEAPHKALHDSAVRIREVYRHADPELPQFLVEKELDHVVWVSAVQAAIIHEDPDLHVEFDHKLCGFGKFLYGEEGRKAAADNPELAHIFEEIKEPHHQLHEHGREIRALLAAGDSVAAEKYFAEHIAPTLEKTDALLEEAKEAATAALEGQEKAREIYAHETSVHLSEVQELLHRKKKSMNETAPCEYHD